MKDKLIIPVDDTSLDLIEEALNGGYTVDEEGTHIWQGSGFPLYRLLDFWSGFDKDKNVLIGYADDVPIYEHLEPVLSEHDLIRALIAEVRRLRREIDGHSDL